MAEIWREAPGKPGCFVSDLGRVRNRTKDVRLLPTESGHLACSMYGRTHKVHQLIAAAFHGPKPCGLVVMHMNHIPWDNRPENLRYGTVGENIRMDFEVGTRSNRGDRAPHRTLSEADVLTIRASKLTNTELAGIYNVSRPNISKVRNFVTWTEVPNVAGPSLTSKTPTGETHMAKAPKTISAADKKAQMAGLKQALSLHNGNIKSISAAVKEAAQAKAAAEKVAKAELKEINAVSLATRKAADEEVARANKVADAGYKTVQAKVASASKAYEAAKAKAEKQEAAAEKGTAKLQAQMAALEAMPVAVAEKVAKPAKVKAAAAEQEATV